MLMYSCISLSNLDERGFEPFYKKNKEKMLKIYNENRNRINIR